MHDIYKPAEMFWNHLYPTWSKKNQSFTLSVSLNLAKFLNPSRQDAFRSRMESET